METKDASENTKKEWNSKLGKKEIITNIREGIIWILQVISAFVPSVSVQVANVSATTFNWVFKKWFKIEKRK